MCVCVCVCVCYCYGSENVRVCVCDLDAGWHAEGAGNVNTYPDSRHDHLTSSLSDPDSWKPIRFMTTQLVQLWRFDADSNLYFDLLHIRILLLAAYFFLSTVFFFYALCS
jgi:hypothetical protein